MKEYFKFSCLPLIDFLELSRRTSSEAKTSLIRGEGHNQIFELSFWHPGGTTAHKNKALSEN